MKEIKPGTDPSDTIYVDSMTEDSLNGFSLVVAHNGDTSLIMMQDDKSFYGWYRVKNGVLVYSGHTTTQLRTDLIKTAIRRGWRVKLMQHSDLHKFFAWGQED